MFTAFNLEEFSVAVNVAERRARVDLCVVAIQTLGQRWLVKSICAHWLCGKVCVALTVKYSMIETICWTFLKRSAELGS